ncbi:response regulator transcription factor [Flavobacteriaceae bacterium]|nr:response regulator transcription factor [Flavobacteriaceae bacterium]MDB2555411.1 response regulator transcription factor [Flavobacteriaceae bacterium]MDB4192328.1 response regulator transcription factor [Flavobacteriaceae bacterium]MDB4236673.1 response regulator transcription factor [Flavobacteriaceae bacterium]MDB9780932.1 response regulator transcription factor [Flavobacteriaceae bacterium]
MKEKIQVHIADDHKILIEGIVAVINTESDIEIEGFSLTGKAVIDWAEDHSADILILDINMPIYDGIEVLKFFKIKKINLKVIILSSYDDVKLVQEMINLGASGFLSKDSAGQHIVEAIRTVHAGEQYFSNTVKNNLLKLYTGKNVKLGQRPQSTIVNSLTDRETEVLKLISQEYSSPEIAQILNISQSTVDTYRKSLLKKTNVKNAVGLAMYAVKNKII